MGNSSRQVVFPREIMAGGNGQDLADELGPASLDGMSHPRGMRVKQQSDK